MRQINHVDHVAYMVRPENHDAYKDKLQTLFDFEFETEHHVPGLRFTWSWSTGLELLSPIGHDEPAAKTGWDFLEMRGEGVFGVVFGVPDVKLGYEHALALGYQPGHMLTLETEEPWRKQLDFRQFVVERFLGSNLLMSEIHYPDPTEA